MKSECELCKLDRRTRWYAELPRFVVLDCETCGMPMWVQRRHGFYSEITLAEARAYCRMIFGGPGLTVRFSGPKSIADHYHEHVHVTK